MDQSKFAKAITNATTLLPNPDMSEEGIKVRETAVILRLSATFCASAKELKADPDAPNVWQ